jgi:hypothetical protein
MNQEEIVRPDGQISAMLVGEVPVAGAAADLSKFLVEQTSHRLCESKVMDDLSRSSERTIYVGEEVGRSGAVHAVWGYLLLGSQSSQPEDSGRLPDSIASFSCARKDRNTIS